MINPKAYVTSAIASFIDMPDSDFQRGYLAALVAVLKEGFDDPENEMVKLGNRILDETRGD